MDPESTDVLLVEALLFLGLACMVFSALLQNRLDRLRAFALSIILLSFAVLELWLGVL
jgi:hypothetical protein